MNLLYYSVNMLLVCVLLIVSTTIGYYTQDYIGCLAFTALGLCLNKIRTTIEQGALVLSFVLSIVLLIQHGVLR